MSRLPPIPPSSMSPEQREAHEECSVFCSKGLGESGDQLVWKDENGALVGPFAPILYTPSLMHSFIILNTALGKLPSFPAEAREVAILATGSIYQTKYELYAHERIAATKTSLTASQIEAVKNGKKPSGEHVLDEQCEVAFDVAVELSNKKGNMSNLNWKRAEQAFGKEGAAALIQVCAVYAWASVLMNAADVPAPE
jgi:4-carboxymuconolactone decarboxylase